MGSLRILSASEQVAEHLRGELLRRTWSGLLPGANALTTALGVNHKTVEAALGQLEREGVLEGRGPGRARRIVPPGGADGAVSLRIGILFFEPVDRQLDYMIEIQHRLEEAGHEVIAPPRTMRELGWDVRRIKRMVERSTADAWLVLAGTREVLAWFASQPLPVFALSGQTQGLPIASMAPDKVPAMLNSVRQLVGLGHRRIVLLTREGRRKPGTGVFERAFLEELERNDLAPSGYNLPDWEESAAGFNSVFESLFRVTPPTAVVLDQAEFVAPFLQFCAQSGLTMPEDVSLLCNDPDPSFEWVLPAVAHISWSGRRWARRIVRWAHNVSLGREDRRQSRSAASLVTGGTIVPVVASAKASARKPASPPKVN